MNAFFLSMCVFLSMVAANPSKTSWQMNASVNKVNEFRKFFAIHEIDLTASHVDLKEIDAEPLTVVVHKASAIGQKILVEDTSLDIEGADVGINVKWLLDTLPEHAGKKALWRVLLAYRDGDKVYVYQGTVSGTIVKPRGSGGFGFDPVFLPDGSQKTLAEEKPDSVNARYYAVNAFIENKPFQVVPAIDHWHGK